MTQTELLAPAKDFECGAAAIDSGADAVYIGAARFGARSKAGNPLDEIAALVEHAHTYWARVYVTVNTLLYDHELPQAVALIHQLYEVGADAVIIQDVGLLECDLPPIPLIASTQMHNHTPERVAFLEDIGFHRVILARELSLAQIRAIRAQTTLELESFVHGALCVSYSGQCYMSYAVGARSGNRGECAQPCRRRYTLVDREGTPVVEDRYLLSLRDLNLSAHLDELLDAGITSFKIEGRLKDITYVKNVVSFYRAQLDAALQARGWHNSSSGHSTADFIPDPTKTFNRGYTTYFLHSREDPPGALDTPKMVGEEVGMVVAVRGKTFTLAPGSVPLHSGDGLSFFVKGATTSAPRLNGTVVNAVQGQIITPNAITGIRKGMTIYRNHDHVYLNEVLKSTVVRNIAVHLSFDETPDGFTLTATDEDDVTVTETLVTDKVAAKKPDQARATLDRQLRKMGNTPFTCAGLDVTWQTASFLPISTLNDLRRRTLDALTAARTAKRPVRRATIQRNSIPYPATHLTYRGNALNEKAVAFYRRHGVTTIDPAAESGIDLRGQPVMRTKYCIKHQLGLCDGTRKRTSLKEPLYLIDDDGHRYRLRFDCDACEMIVEY